MIRLFNKNATGVAPDGRLFAGDINALQDIVAALDDLTQTLGVGVLKVGEDGLQLVRYGTGDMRVTGALRSDGIMRALGGMYAGAFTTTARNAISTGSRPYGLVILNTTTNRFEWNAGSDATPDWQPIALDGTGHGPNETPVGGMIEWPTSIAPDGWLLCDGAAVSRTIYADLFAVLNGDGLKWGNGNGTTTFNVPDKRGKVGVGLNSGTFSQIGNTGGEETHTLLEAELASHNHGGTVIAVSAGTPAGTISAVSAGTPAGTINSVSAGTPAGTISSDSGGTPAGTINAVSAGTPAGTINSVSAGTPAGTISAVSAGTPAGTLDAQGAHTHTVSLLTGGGAIAENHITVSATGASAVENTDVAGTDSQGIHTHTFTGTPLGTHVHVFTGSVLAGHSHAFAGTAMGTHSHTFAGNALTNHTHTFTGAALAGHAHTFTGTALGTHAHVFAGTAMGTHTHGIAADGSNAAHNNLQPYAVVNFIIKF